MARSGKINKQTTAMAAEAAAETTNSEAIDDQKYDETLSVDATDQDETVSEADEIPADERPLVEAKPPRSGANGFGGLLIGGIIAAGVGFLAAQYSGNDYWPFASNNSVTDGLDKKIAGLESTVEEQQAELQKLTLELAAKSNSIELGGLREKIQEADAVSESLSNDLAGLASRLTDIENRPIPENGSDQDAVDYYVQELAAMRAMLVEELANIAARRETVAVETLDVAEIARSNAIQQAKSQIEMAAQNGLPFVDPVDVLLSAGIEITPGLGAVAKTGIPTLAALSGSFPPAARQALAVSAAASSPESNNNNGVVAFLRNQLGIRSLEPISGEGVDAVLSRAEAAVFANDIAAALNELEALPESAVDEMRTWIERAGQRQDALQMIMALVTPVSE